MNLLTILDPYEILQKNNSSICIKLKKSVDIKAILLTGVLVPSIIIAFFVIKKEIQVLAVMLPPLLAYVRMLQIKDPIVILAQKGRLVLTYKKYFGGQKDIILDASEVKDFVPQAFCTSRDEFWIASVQVRLSNSKTKRIFSAPRGKGKKEAATLHSEIVAKMYMDIFNGDTNWQNALTSRSS
jgi:hypothetical protein